MNSWKEASTIILTAFNKSLPKSQGNYSILSLKRSSKSSFMPNACVFPGGVTDPADSSKKWLDIFSNFSVVENCKTSKNDPPIIANKVGDIPKLTSLKITAIRETFEETGILLCFSKNHKPDDCTSFQNIENVDLWRSKVQKSGSEFLNLCLENNCCPDINNIHLWSNWLTPTSLGAKRFDTAFFVACLKVFPNAEADKQETQALNWLTPKELLTKFKNQEIWLPPPQLYEISRLSNFEDMSDFKSFAASRSCQGCERWMPVQVNTTDGQVSLLPGDEAYAPTDLVTLSKPEKVNVSTEEYRSQFKVLHRMEFLKKTATKVIVKNYNPTDGHKLPVADCKKIHYCEFFCQDTEN